jgi:hypothetical protein
LNDPRVIFQPISKLHEQTRLQIDDAAPTPLPNSSKWRFACKLNTSSRRIRLAIALTPCKIAQFARHTRWRNMVQPAVELFYGVPIGAIIAWYPPPDKKLPRNFAYCDGSTVSDKDSPFDKTATPNLTYMFPLGSGPDVPIGQKGGQQTLYFDLPGPGWLAVHYIMRIK